MAKLSQYSPVDQPSPSSNLKHSTEIAKMLRWLFDGYQFMGQRFINIAADTDRGIDIFARHGVGYDFLDMDSPELHALLEDPSLQRCGATAVSGGFEFIFAARQPAHGTDRPAGASAAVVVEDTAVPPSPSPAQTGEGALRAAGPSKTRNGVGTRAGPKRATAKVVKRTVRPASPVIDLIALAAGGKNTAWAR